MGGIVSYFFGPDRGRTDDPDPATGLTSRDVFLVQSSWAFPRKDPTTNGALVLLTFFRKHPDTLSMFPFKDVPVDKLNLNKKFLAHCNSVMYALSALVDNLRDPELLTALLSKTGKNHKRIPGMTKKGFWDLKDVIIEIFSTLMDKQTVAAWDKTLGVAFKVITDEL